jgi:CheY-like chemotaxis protein
MPMRGTAYAASEDIMRILIADDQRNVAEIISQMVRSCDHELVGTVTTGGLDVIAAYDRLSPDVVIMDIQMPRLNGLTACHVLMTRTPAPKVIFFSGNYDREHPFVQKSGACGFLAKPATVDQLRLALQELAEPTAVACVTARREGSTTCDCMFEYSR